MNFSPPKKESEILAAAINIVAVIADSNPGAVVDAVPKLAALLKEGSPADVTAITAIQRVAEAYDLPLDAFSRGGRPTGRTRSRGSNTEGDVVKTDAEDGSSVSIMLLMRI